MRKFLLLILCLSLFGCANRVPMAIDSSNRQLELGNQSLLLLVLEIKRQERSRYVPVPDYLHFDLIDANGEVIGKSLPLDRDGAIQGSDGQTLYAFRITAPTPEIRLTEIFGRAKLFPVEGKFTLPLGMTIRPEAGSILYLGHVDALLRPRAEHEYRAGGLLPQTDQAAAGFSTGTFDIQVSDRFDDDMKLLRARFPALQNQLASRRITSVPPRQELDLQWQARQASGSGN